MEVSRRCNLRCAYCYAHASSDQAPGLADDEVRQVIDEAVANGARLVSFVWGGEPFLRRDLVLGEDGCLAHANRRGCFTYLYTNGTLIDDAAASRLADLDVSVVGKCNSLRDDVQDLLAGVPGSSREIQRGVDALLRAGLADGQPSRLALETVICRQNYDEMPDLWRWMRRQNIVPEVEIITVHGRAMAQRGWLCFAPEEAPGKYQAIFEELARIDREEFGFHWTPHPPFPAAACQLFHSNAYVNDRGGVQPCAGIDQEYGVLRVGPRAAAGQPLAEILGSPEFQKLRCVEAHLQEPCRGCDLLGECYGCRGAAWNLTGDLFAGDPVCWRRRPAG
jgi:radical SAM protein with 4Fe4S-binding SPASM domain